MIKSVLCSALTFHIISFPLLLTDKIEISGGVNIKLCLTGEDESAEGAGPTLEFVFEKEETHHEEEEQRGQSRRFCINTGEKGRTEPCS